MTQYLASTPISLGVCGKCQAYVFQCHVDGMLTAVDPKPLDASEARAALIAGRALYNVLVESGRPTWLQDRTIDSTWPPKHQIVASHPCRSTVHKVDTSAGKATARANPTALRDSSARATHAGSATNRHSDDSHRYLYRRCGKCTDFIGLSTDVIGLKVGQYWEWIEHANCDGVPSKWCEVCGRIDVTKQKDGTWFRHLDCSGEHWCGDEMSDND